MIFVLRVIIFSALILTGFAISTRSIRLRKVVTVIYTFVLLWYTFLCRLPMFTSVPVAADSTITTSPSTEMSFAESLIEAVIAIFGPQPDGTLAGDGVVRAMTFNILLFIPCGYLTAMWLLQLRGDTPEPGKRCSRITAVAICTVVSILIELLQSLTRLGIADVKDVIGNCIGSVIGVVMVMLYEWKRAARG